ncbi:class I SAM-dependent methyltransferase [Limnohabitans sp. 2KL-27]|uniref:class I SAM-dependent methyltransferase n=1 Tax=Limnohabitans sp. 2KL-27 TaxID=1100705 RepID=UPI000B7FCF11|nr:methyltransferase domain-containing protein [Limnohabitans sp. 2KL-27]
MESQIIESQYSGDAWLARLGQPVASRLLAWEQQQADDLLADVFGYHAVQLGWPQLQALRSNRMPHRWMARAEFEPILTQPAEAQAEGAHVCLDSRAWPWAADSLDLVVLPHTLERSADPHACLREVERVLIPEGQVLITGLNPWSLWGWPQTRGGRGAGLGDAHVAALIGYRRLRDWLRLLGFEVQVSRFGGWTPALGSERWMQRLQWMDTLGERWWPILGGVYLIMATKRVPGGRLIDGRRWRTVRSPAAATVPVARSDTTMGQATAPKEFVDPR